MAESGGKRFPREVDLTFAGRLKLADGRWAALPVIGSTRGESTKVSPSDFYYETIY